MARSKSTRWYAALIVLLAFILLAWLLGAVLTLTDGERVALRVGLVVLGLVAAGALLWFLRPVDEPAAAPAAAGRDEALATVAAARARLQRGVFDAKPIVLVLGSQGSCKTTVVTRSGTDPQLLAGDAPPTKGDAPKSTSSANVWLIRDAVLAEPAADVLADAARWRRFVRAMRGPRLAAAFGRGKAPPRAAVVCVSCDHFYTGAAGEHLEGLGRLTRERLAEASKELGVALPVYVLFTKADRIPHFEDWAAPFTSEEIRAPLGAALPFDNATQNSAARSTAAGAYAERVTPRLDAAMAGIVAALAARRAQLLGRESVTERRLGAYELPREMGKLSAPVARFLIELCRPMHLGVSPQLRGFYFVGARPVLVSECGATGCREARARTDRSSGRDSRVRLARGGGCDGRTSLHAAGFAPRPAVGLPRSTVPRCHPCRPRCGDGRERRFTRRARSSHAAGRWHCGGARCRGRRDSLVGGQSVAGEPCDGGRRGRGGPSGRSVTGRSGDLPFRRRADSSRRASGDARYARRVSRRRCADESPLGTVAR